MRDGHFELLVQNWIESERGWGHRHDGFSLHFTEQDRQDYIHEHWLAYPDYPDITPDEYSAPFGDPYRMQVPFETFTQVMESINGVWYSDSNRILFAKMM